MANPHGNIANLTLGRGRTPGVPNRYNASFRDALLKAFQANGGWKALAAWGAKAKNQTAFYQICARLVPTEVVGAGGGPLKVRVIHEHHDDAIDVTSTSRVVPDSPTMVQEALSAALKGIVAGEDSSHVLEHPRAEGDELEVTVERGLDADIEDSAGTRQP